MCKKSLIAAAITFALSGHGFAQDAFIAGVDVSKRPGTAPVVSKVKKGSGWYAGALHGVVKPFPYSLHFLENQGNWFNPFIHPGMTGPYDIRGWHKGK